ncbi:SRPBCC domain-containing protein [Flavobacterium sp.]|uniref:SRPBCC domain-containing protein n=1 Tax=Flavobacterium sp. TaxID=239 RepID=UPI003D116479
MKTLTFEISIQATKEKVWYSLWDEPNYEYWTTSFCEGSNAISSWQEGDKIHFLDPNNNGMSSRIFKKTPFECMIFEHITEIRNGIEVAIDDTIQQWTGCQEQYFLSEKEGITTLKVITQTITTFEDFFMQTMPKALEKVKELAEQPTTQNLTVRTHIKASIEKTWNYFTQAQHIQQWNHASDDWHCPKSENPLVVGEKFATLMAAKDNSVSFEFSGTYTQIESPNILSYTIADGRKVTVKFNTLENQTLVTEIFEPETTHALSLQRQGWQAILDNFKKYVEQN